MQVRFAIGCLAFGALVACAPPVPDSGAKGPGFERDYSDFTTYRAQRDAELVGSAPVGSTPPVPPTQTAGDPTLRAAAAALEAPDQPATTTPTGDTTVAATVVTDNPAISDEQNFDAVSSRESIESDAERLRAQREAFVEVQPTAVPTRGSAGPNIVAYAISTRHPVGTKVHRRPPFTSQARFDRACARYASPDLAQEAFLEAGGPDRDRLRIDPDGDGYACAWDPAPFRQLAAAGRG